MRNRLVLLAFLAPALAWSQGLADFEGAVPSFPCQDGWMGCVQDGNVVSPDLLKDSSGMPLPADMRVGWFDLTPTTNFTPFGTLSEYTGAEPKRINSTPEPDPDAVAAVDGTEPDPDAADANPEPDAVADAGFMDPEAERARLEEQARLDEERRAANDQKQAKAEAERARREELQRQQAADRRADEAAAAMKAIQMATTDADRKRAQEEAQAAKEAQKKADAQAAEAARMRQERERQEEQARKDAAAAAEAAKRAQADRERKEAEERRKAEEARQAELARQAEADRLAQKAADEAAAKAAAESEKRAAEAKKRAEDAERAAKAANDEAARQKAEEDRRKAEADRVAAEKAAAAEAEAARKQAEADAKKKAEEERLARAAEQKAQQEAEKARLKAEADAKAGNATPETGDGVAAAAGGCEDLSGLEPNAMLGKLGKGTQQCLETKLQASTRQTEKNRVSRLLMANAFNTNDLTEWERLMKRHLETIDQSDPNLCYKYASRLSRKGPGHAYSVIKWSDIALENRAVWTGATYTTRVSSLYKFKAYAAQKIWSNLEDKHAASPTDESNEKVKSARNRTKVFAREWYEYAKASGKDTKTALDLCTSAAGTKKYCEAG